MKLIDIADRYCPHIERVIKDSCGIKYEAMFIEPNSDALNQSKLNPNEALELIQQLQSIYVLGILERSHLACITSLARTSRWLSSTNRSVSDGNALAFSSSLRGLLESSSDTFYLMQTLFPTLQNASKYIYIALKFPKDIRNKSLNFKELEDLLIHYAYAKHWKKGDEPLPNHRNKTNAFYINCLEEFDVPGLSDLYSELCQLTHPASPSVFCFVDETDKDITFNPNKDSAVINDILIRYENSIERLIQYPLNSAFMALSLLHRLVPHWPAGMTDEQISTIGKMAKILNEFDIFSNSYLEGTGLSDLELNSAGGY